MPTIPLWLMKALPYIAFALALGAAVWFIDHKGYQRAKTQDTAASAKADLLRADMKAAIRKQTSDLEGSMRDMASQEDTKLHDAISKIDIKNTTIIQPALQKEIKSNARFSDPSAGITVGMLNALNQARSSSSSAGTPVPVR